MAIGFQCRWLDYQNIPVDNNKLQSESEKKMTMTKIFIKNNKILEYVWDGILRKEGLRNLVKPRNMINED